MPIKTRRALDGLVCALFGLALLAPAIDLYVRDGQARSPLREGRGPAPSAVWSCEYRALPRFPAQFEAHFADTLGLRDRLLCLRSHLLVDSLGTSPTKDVLIGRDGWMFFAGEDGLATWRGMRPFTTAELRTWQHALEVRRDQAARVGARYYFVIAPNKETIYPEFMPAGLAPVGPTRFDQFMLWMQAHSDVRCIDLRPDFKAARAEDRPGDFLYYEDDTHWNGRGGMVACAAIVADISRDFPAMASLGDIAWSRIDRAGEAESWRDRMYLARDPKRVQHLFVPADGLGRSAVLLPMAQGDARVHEQRAPDPRLPNVLLFHDSFGPGIEGQLAEHCATLREWQSYDFPGSELLLSPAQVVIDLFVERVLSGANPITLEPPPLPAGVARAGGLEAWFAASREVLVAFDASGADAIETSGGLTYTRVDDERGTGLVLRTHSRDDTLLLPGFPKPARGAWVLVMIEVDSPVRTAGGLFYRFESEAKWNRAYRFRLNLVPGPNRRIFPLCVSEPVARLSLRPGLEWNQDYVFRRLEVRAFDAP